MITGDLRVLFQDFYHIDEYPCCYEQFLEWNKTKPLKGMKILDATPVFRNTLVKYEALLSAGAEVSIGLSPLISHDPEIIGQLKENGFSVLYPDMDQYIEYFDLILDCAAVYSHWQPRIGYSELTRSGVDAYRNSDKPVFVADSGRIKKIETCLGTGESYFRAMKQLGYSEWKGRKIVIFGSCKVGSGLILYAHFNKVEITVVTDPETISEKLKPFIKNVISLNDNEAIVAAIKDAYAVVTATGIRHALSTLVSPEVIVDSPALLANMGVVDEFGDEIPVARVLNNKRTLNFILEEPTHLKFIDATFALHNAGAVYLKDKAKEKGIINPPVEMEEELLEISREKGIIRDNLQWID